MLDNSALPSGALVYNAGDRQLTSEQYERLKSELEAGFQGARNAGRRVGETIGAIVVCIRCVRDIAGGTYADGAVGRL